MRFSPAHVKFVGAVFIAMVLLVPSSARAVTVTTFVAVEKGQTLRIENPQPEAVAGRISLVPESGSSTVAATSFSLPPGGSQPFAIDSLLSQQSGIVVIDASNAVRVVSHPALPLAHAARSSTAAFHFLAGKPDGELLLGLFGGDARLSLYTSSAATTPVAVRTYSGGGTPQTFRIALRDLLPEGATTFEGRAVVEPFSGQAVIAATSLAPIRHRAARSAPEISPPIINVSGPTTLCEFSSGIHAIASGDAATYAWSVFNASAQSALNGSGLDATSAGSGYATLVLHAMRAGGPARETEVNVRVAAKPAISALDAPSAVVAQPLTIRWDASGEGSGTLSGSDFAAPVPVSLAAKSYTYTPTTGGSKTVMLGIDGACGTAARSASYSVAAACTAPSAAVSAPASAVAGATFTASMPAGAASYTWAAVANCTLQAGQGTRVATFQASAAGLSAQVRGTASNGAGCTATDTAAVQVSAPAPAITAFSVSPAQVDQFDGPVATVTFTLQNADAWTITMSSTTKGWAAAMGSSNYFNDPASSLGGTTWKGALSCDPNTACTPKTTGTISLRIFSELANNDSIVLSATGAGGTAQQSIPFRVTGGNCAYDGPPPTSVPVGGTATLRIMWVTSDPQTLVTASSVGNSVSPPSMPLPATFGHYSFTYSRSTPGDDLVKITGTGCVMQFLIK